MKVWINLRYTVADRLKAFVAGIERHGYKAEIGLPDRIGNKDLLISWNRIGRADTVAKQFEQRLLPVLIAENAAWGNDFLGRRWYSLAKNYHNTAGRFPYLGPERWDNLGVDLQPFRQSGSMIVLPQRGIGSPPTRMPSGWAQQVAARYGARIRPHPGKAMGKPLEKDLEGVSVAVTWGSGAAIKALMLGVSVISEMPNWIGYQDNTEQGRLEMFRHLACAQWQLHEIESGLAFEHLLK